MESSHIRSFVRRQGRMTQRQRYALSHYFSHYGIELKNALDFKKKFPNDTPILLEIGFGMGESLAKLAEENSNWNFVGVDVHRPGIGALLATLHEKKLNNVKIIEQDVVQLFERFIPPYSIDMIQVLFPDPWPKKRHHKRRLIQSSFLKLILPTLKSNGILYIATDWEDYANHIQMVLHHWPQLKPIHLKTIKHPLLNNRLQTKFEMRGLNKGHRIIEFILKKQIS
jgi:tRNA (guanine-N7-)-methyltransferase